MTSEDLHTHLTADTVRKLVRPKTLSPIFEQVASFIEEQAKQLQQPGLPLLHQQPVGWAIHPYTVQICLNWEQGEHDVVSAETPAGLVQKIHQRLFDPREKIFQLINEERQRQVQQWGIQRHHKMK